MDRRRFLSLAALTAGAAALGSKVAAAATSTTRALTPWREPAITVPPDAVSIVIELWGGEGRMSRVKFDVARRSLDGTMLTALVAKRTDGGYTILTNPQFSVQHLIP